jgi:hypothetical protein
MASSGDLPEKVSFFAMPVVFLLLHCSGQGQPLMYHHVQGMGSERVVSVNRANAEECLSWLAAAADRTYISLYVGLTSGGHRVDSGRYRNTQKRGRRRNVQRSRRRSALESGGRGEKKLTVAAAYAGQWQSGGHG